MNVLMVGVDASTRGGMWTVVENYLGDRKFVEENNLIYVPTSIVGNPLKKVLFMLKGFRQIRRVFRQERVDLVHVHMSERGSVWRKGLVMRYAKKHNARVLLHMHGAELEVWYRSLDGKKQQKVRNVVDLADAVVILGDYWKDFMAELVTDPEKIRVVHNAVKVPARPLYSRDSRDLLFLGAVSRRKGIYDLLDAMKRISPELPGDWKLRIYGPDVIGNVEEEIEKRQLSDRVSYCGWLSADHREAALSRTGINLLPSYNEGLPMTILEAMAAGIPTVTTDVAAIPEAVTPDNGVLLKPGDVEGLGRSILDLCLDSEARSSKSRAARQTAEEKFSLERHLADIRRIYKELIPQ